MSDFGEFFAGFAPALVTGGLEARTARKGLEKEREQLEWSRKFLEEQRGDTNRGFVAYAIAADPNLSPEDKYRKLQELYPNVLSGLQTQPINHPPPPPPTLGSYYDANILGAQTPREREALQKRYDEDIAFRSISPAINLQATPPLTPEQQREAWDQLYNRRGLPQGYLKRR